MVWEGDYEGEPDGLAGYTEVTGDARISQSATPDLVDLSCLERVAGTLRIYNNIAIESLAGLERLQEVGVLELVQNVQLSDISALGNLHTAGELIVWSNTELGSLVGLEGIERVDARVYVTDNGLESLAGLDSLRVVDGYLRISVNPYLVDLAGLSQVEEVRGLAIVNNAGLQSLDGLEALTRVNGVVTNGTAYGQVEISSNGELIDVGALFGASVVDVDGIIKIDNNPKLPQCDAEDLAATLEPAGWQGTTTVENNQGTCP